MSCNAQDGLSQLRIIWARNVKSVVGERPSCVEGSGCVLAGRSVQCYRSEKVGGQGPSGRQGLENHGGEFAPS